MKANLVPLFKEMTSYENYMKFHLVRLCRDYEVQPNQLIAMADSDLWDKIGNIILITLRVNIKGLNINKNYYEFRNPKEQIRFYRAVIYNYCLKSEISFDHFERLINRGVIRPEKDFVWESPYAAYKNLKQMRLTILPNIMIDRLKVFKK
jgi:hypothetical protein